MFEAIALNFGNAGLALDENQNSLTFEKNAAKPNSEAALDFRHDRMIGKKGKTGFKPYSVCQTTAKDLGEYGVALELYFLAIKQIGYLFLLISVISIWPMYENYIGSGLEDGDKNQAWDVLTLANQYKYSYNMTKADAENKVNSYENSKIRLVIADLIYTLVFIFFVVSFQMTSDKKIQSNDLKFLTVADYAVEITGLPEICSSQDLTELLSKFGNVREVYLARKYNGLLSTYKSRALLLTEMKYQERLRNKGFNNQKKIKQLENNISKLDTIIKSKQEKIGYHNDLPVIKAYAVFDDLADKKSCLKTFRKNNYCCRRYNPNLKIQNRKLKVSRTSEPSNILWENIEYNKCKRFMRSIISAILVCCVISASVAIIYFVRSYDNELPNEKYCVTKEGTNPDLTLEEAKIHYQTDTQKYCYCRVQSVKSVISDSSLRTYCTYYLEKRSLGILIRFSACTAVVMINFFIKISIRILSRFEKEESKSKELVKVMSKVFIAMFINTSLVVLAVNADFSSIEFIKKLPFNEYLFTSEFSDFTRRWYVQAGSTITITMLVSIFSPHIMNYLIFYPRGACKRRCCLGKYKTQYEMNLAFAGPEFDIATRYSQILNVVFSSFLYSGGIPLLNCTCCATMFVLYWTDKFLILRHYSRPPRYSAELNSNFLKFLPFAGILHCGFSLYMIGSETVFPEGFHTENGFLYPDQNSLADRIVSVTGFLYIAIMCIAGFIYVYVACSNMCAGKSNAVAPEEISKKFGEVRSKIGQYGLTSYNIKDNKDYCELVHSIDNAANNVSKLKYTGLHDKSSKHLMDNSIN